MRNLNFELSLFLIVGLFALIAFISIYSNADFGLTGAVVENQIINTMPKQVIDSKTTNSAPTATQTVQSQLPFTNGEIWMQNIATKEYVKLKDIKISDHKEEKISFSMKPQTTIYDNPSTSILYKFAV